MCIMVSLGPLEEGDREIVEIDNLEGDERDLREDIILIIRYFVN